MYYSWTENAKIISGDLQQHAGECVDSKWSGFSLRSPQKNAPPFLFSPKVNISVSHHMQTNLSDCLCRDLAALIHLFINSCICSLTTDIKFSTSQHLLVNYSSSLHTYVKHKLAGWSLAEASHWMSCHIMPSVIVLLKSYSPAVLLLSLPLHKLLSSVYPPSGTSVGGSWVGGSIRLGSYWKGRKWVEWTLEVLQSKSRRTNLCNREEFWE